MYVRKSCEENRKSLLLIYRRKSVNLMSTKLYSCLTTVQDLEGKCIKSFSNENSFWHIWSACLDPLMGAAVVLLCNPILVVLFQSLSLCFRGDNLAFSDNISEHSIGDHSDNLWQPADRNLLQLHHVHGGELRGDHHHDPQLPPPEAGHSSDAGLGEWQEFNKQDHRPTKTRLNNEHVCI